MFDFWGILKLLQRREKKYRATIYLGFTLMRFTILDSFFSRIFKFFHRVTVGTSRKAKTLFFLKVLRVRSSLKTFTTFFRNCNYQGLKTEAFSL